MVHLAITYDKFSNGKSGQWQVRNRTISPIFIWVETIFVWYLQVEYSFNDRIVRRTNFHLISHYEKKIATMWMNIKHHNRTILAGKYVLHILLWFSEKFQQQTSSSFRCVKVNATYGCNGTSEIVHHSRRGTERLYHTMWIFWPCIKYGEK